jgi:hypothetical protein
MNLTTRIIELRRIWSTAFSSLPLCLQLAPKSETGEHAVLSIQSVDQDRSTTTRINWQASMMIRVTASTDTAALSIADTVAETFNRCGSELWHTCIITSANFDANYLEKGSKWIVDFSLTVAWTTERN